MRPSPYRSGKKPTDAMSGVRGSLSSARASGSAFWPTTAHMSARPASWNARAAPSALGAARAFQEAGRADTCAVVGQNAEPDARAELREPRTPLIASVGFFPERYGDGLIKLALDILGHRQTPPALFIRHQLITTENVDHFYPNDSLLGPVTPAPTTPRTDRPSPRSGPTPLRPA